MKLGLHAENHVGWSALAIGGNGGMKGAQQVVVRQVGKLLKKAPAVSLAPLHEVLCYLFTSKL